MNAKNISGCSLVHDGSSTTKTVMCSSDNFKPIVDDYTVFIFQIVGNVFLNGIVCIFGIVGNVFNILVFFRQGIFTESGTAGIFGLAVSDLCSVASMFWLCVIESVVLAKPQNLSWDPEAVKTVTAFWVHMMFVTITRIVTVYIALERCICVIFPFKVKSLLTPRRGIVIMSVAALVVGFLHISHFLAFRLRFIQDPATNSTRLVMVTNVKFQSIALDKMIYVLGYGANIFSVLAVFVCTLITAIRINLSKTWRESVSTGSSSTTDKDKSKSNESMSKSKMQKEARLIRMIIMISIIFLICYLPLLVYLVMITADKDLGLRGKYKNFSRVMYTLSFLAGTINSSINIIIYYTMSTRYRDELKALLRLKTK